MSCNDPALRYVQRTPAGADYVSQITAQDEDRSTRSAFRDLVLNIAPPGARLFDFGAGPGIDARFFAEHDFAVDAYDVDPRMREYFADHCRNLIDLGRVTLEDGTYGEFLTRKANAGRERANLVVSNFAPLNLVDNLRELFVKFNQLTGSRGQVLASVLNPCFIGDLRGRAWWRGAPRLWRDGELFLPGPQAPYYRRLLNNFRAMSAPHFRLRCVFRGLPANPAEPPRGFEGHLAWLHVARCRYMFLLFDKTSGE